MTSHLLRSHSSLVQWLFGAFVVGMALAGCAGPAGESAPEPAMPTSVLDPSHTALRERLAAIDEAVTAWRGAGSLDEARAAAETAANLVVGPNGPGYGDRDGDGIIAGESETGLLPGGDGSPEGLAMQEASNPCIAADVLGEDWDDPQAAWQAMLSAIAAWEPGNNTMPTLPSHPMRVVGWATFTLAADTIEEAHEFAGHAGLHVDISVRALDC